VASQTALRGTWRWHAASVYLGRDQAREEKANADAKDSQKKAGGEEPVIYQVLRGVPGRGETGRRGELSSFQKKKERRWAGSWNNDLGKVEKGPREGGDGLERAPILRNLESTVSPWRAFGRGHARKHEKNWSCSIHQTSAEPILRSKKQPRPANRGGEEKKIQKKRGLKGTLAKKKSKS